MIQPHPSRPAPWQRALALLAAVTTALLIGSCAQLPSTGVTSIVFQPPGKDSKELESESVQTQVVQKRLGVHQFRLRGPFAVTTRNGETLRLSAKERIPMDLYLSSENRSAPLVILLHGYNNTRADHAYQGMHLATWGMNSIVLQLPNRGSWINNGRTLARVVEYLRKRPSEFPNVDLNRIILVGHSFGASAVAYALAQGAPASGAVLLDPASFGAALPAALSKISRPVIVLGADEEIFPARGRDLFFRHIRSNVGELSIRNAGHEDAQFRLKDSGREEQLDFLSALTAGVISISSTGQLDFAWQSYTSLADAQRFYDLRLK
ncbi:MAG: alpha/beta hydrolase [Betaproteobacteria bacterium]|jgi:pimeloyl-ACP methyl ester carboxylesterase|nr:alpha/beta fold hydrolase [Betaproteobacteria bacterium]